MAFLNAVIKDSDMDQYMQEEALNVAADGMDRHDIDKDMASHLKQYFNLKYGRTWHCIVGKQFGSFSNDNLLVIILSMFIYFNKFSSNITVLIIKVNENYSIQPLLLLLFMVLLKVIVLTLKTNENTVNEIFLLDMQNS
ncbi:unnamed protein product [Schistosoma spindalis]|nr:unnamed protein product [Schistosoma spindale]